MTGHKAWRCLCGGKAAGYLVVSQGVESLPVIVDLSGDVLVLKDDASDPTLPPFCRTNTQRRQT